MDTYNAAVNVMPTADGGCRLILNFASQDPAYQFERICQTYMDSNGNEIWRQYYDSPDTLLNNEYDTQLNYSVPDSGSLITGWCGYRDTTSNNLWYLKCYYIKTNNFGDVNWESVAQKDYSLPGKPGGQAWTTIVNPRKDYYYSSTSHYMYPMNTSSPALLKMDLNGNVVNVYDLVQGYSEGKLLQSAWITDSTLIGSAAWFNGTSGPQESKVVKFDTLGNILQTKTLLMSEYLCYVKKTLDNKFLFYTMRNNSGNPNVGFFNTYLFKLNSDLGFDSINNQPKIYDYLCDQITFQDTIVVNNCDIILTIDNPEQIIEKSKLLLYPNPADQFIKIQLPDYISSTSQKGSIRLTSQNFKYKSNSYIRVYNITGMIVYQKKLSDSDQTIAIDLSEIISGTYFAAIYSQDKNFETAKFIISK